MSNHQTQLLSTWRVTDRWWHALRTAFSALIAGVTSAALHLGDPFWSIVTVFMLSTPYAETTATKSLFRIIGTGLGGIGGLIAASLTANHPELSLVLLFVATTIGTYFALRRRHAYPWILGLVTYYLVAITATGDPAELWPTALWRFVEVVVGVIVILVFGFIFFKRGAAERIPAALERLRSLEAQAWAKLWAGEGQSFPLHLLEEALKQLDTLIEAVRAARRYDSYRLASHSSTLEIHRQLVGDVEDLYRVSEGNPPLASQQVSELEMGEVMKSILEWLEAGALSPNNRAELRQKLLVSWERFETLRERTFGGQWPFERVAITHTVFQACEHLVSHLEEMRQLIEDHEGAKQEKRITWQWSPVPWEVALKRATRIGVSGVVTMLLWVLTSWWGARIGVVSALIVGLEKDAYGTWRRALQRLIGNVSGSVLGIGMLAFFVDDIISFMMGFFPCALIAGYILAGSPRISFVGIQMGMALSMSMLPSNVQMTSVALSLQLVAGVILGSAVAVVASLVLWPTSARRVLDEGLSQGYGLLGDFLKTLGEGKPVPNESVLDLMRVHSVNAELIENMRDERREKIWRNEGVCALHLEALRQEESVIKTQQTLGANLDINFALRELGSRFQDISKTLAQKGALGWNKQQIKGRQQELSNNIDDLRRRQILIRLPAHEASTIVSTLWRLRELYGVLAKYAELYETTPGALSSPSVSVPPLAKSPT